MFRNAIDIMLLRSEGVTEEQETEPQVKRIPNDSEKRASGWLSRDFFLRVFNLSAQDAYQKTQQQIRINSEKMIREEATEILEKALLSIQNAIEEEKFKAELGGPGRTATGLHILKQAYSQYRQDSRKYVCEYLKTQGYEVREVEDVYLLIDWSKVQNESPSLTISSKEENETKPQEISG